MAIPMSIFEKHEGLEERLIELTGKLSQAQIAETLSKEFNLNVTKAMVNRRQKKLGINSNVNNAKEAVKRRAKEHKEKVEKNQQEQLIKFLARGRTYPQIEEKFKIDQQAIDKAISKIDDYELYRTRNTYNEEILVLLPKPVDEIKVKPKVWSYQKQPDGEPYLWIQFPKKLDFTKIKIVPLADAHFGAFAHYREKFDEYINWIAQTPNVFVFINGDLLEFTQGETLKGIAIHEQEKRPKTQIEEMAYKLAPIAHKILWAQPGNHEERARKYDFNPLEWICDKLEIPYFDEPLYVDILWNGYVFDFYSQHGWTNSQTKGGKINAAIKPTQFQEFVMFTIMGHVHDEMVNKIQRICRDRVNFRLQIKKQYIIICPSFYKYFGTYAARKGLPPGSLGAVSCDIYPNGDYHASE